MTENKNKKIILIVIALLVAIILVICFVKAYQNYKNGSTSLSNSNSQTADSISSKYNSVDYGNNKDLSSDTITSSGSYNITGDYNCITVNTSGDVKLLLTNANITCSTGSAINVVSANTVNIVFEGNNAITSKTTEDLDGAIYSKADLILSGSGTINVSSNYDGIVSKDTLVINNGTYNITSSDDGIRGKDNVSIVNGTFTINAGGDGIKSTNEEDSTKGYIAIDGGTINITGNSPFDYDGTAKYTGGTIIVNGQTTNTITNQMMGGDMQGGPGGDMRGQIGRNMR